MKRAPRTNGRTKRTRVGSSPPIFAANIHTYMGQPALGDPGAAAHARNGAELRPRRSLPWSLVSGQRRLAEGHSSTSASPTSSSARAIHARRSRLCTRPADIVTKPAPARGTASGGGPRLLPGVSDRANRNGARQHRRGARLARARGARHTVSLPSWSRSECDCRSRSPIRFCSNLRFSATPSLPRADRRRSGTLAATDQLTRRRGASPAHP